MSELLAMRGDYLAIDEPLAAGIHARAAGLLGALFGVLNRLGNLPGWGAVVGLTAAALWRTGRPRGAMLLLAGLSAEAATAFTKVLAQRPRPPGSEGTDLVPTAGFSSGHVVRVMVTLGLLVALAVWRSPRWGLPALLGAALVLVLLGLARVAFGEHWPSDVLGGYLLGGFWLDALLIASAFWPSSRNSSQTASTPQTVGRVERRARRCSDSLKETGRANG